MMTSPQSFPLLNRDLLGSAGLAVPAAAALDADERILQFGEGNFLRGFADWMVDCLNAAGQFHGRIVVVQPVRQGMAAMLNAQAGAYTVLLRGIQNGAMVEERRLVTAISRCINPHEDWAAVVAAACQPALRFVISNTTEAGIAWLDESYDGTRCPESFPAKVAALLWERFRMAGATANGLVFLPCELIEANGARLREHVLRHAAAWGCGSDFIHWVETRNHFLNTLVDRIVPGYPGAEAERLRNELGYDDKMMVAAEIFHLWVIEGPARLADEIPFHQAGLNVVWTDDMTPFRSRKVRVLNGAHTATVPAAFLAGLDSVGEMMEDPEFGPLVRRVVFDEILPVLDMADAGRRGYAESVIERFRNPFIKHELLSIMLNSVSKWKVRVLPSLLDHVGKHGSPPPMLAFSLAALLRFYDGRPDADGAYAGRRGDGSYPIRDDAAAVGFLADAWAGFHADGALDRMVATVLANNALWGMDLTTVAGLADQVARSLDTIIRKGTRAALPAKP